MSKSKFLVFFLVLIVFPFSSNAMEVLLPSSAVTAEQMQLCSDKIEDFKLLARDAKYYMKTSDCAMIEAGCPLSCRYYMNKVFAGALESRIDEVKEKCSHSVCSSTCPEYDIEAKCLNGVCTYEKR